jgi:hypothetical protein
MKRRIIHLSLSILVLFSHIPTAQAFVFAPALPALFAGAVQAVHWASAGLGIAATAASMIIKKEHTPPPLPVEETQEGPRVYGFLENPNPAEKLIQEGNDAQVANVLKTAQPANPITQPQVNDKKLEGNNPGQGSKDPDKKPDDKDKDKNLAKLAEETNSQHESSDIQLSKDDIPHMLRDDKGHLVDTPSNRKLLLDTANNQKNFLGTDKYGTSWYARMLPNGDQVWTTVRNNIIRNGGLNKVPKIFNSETGLCTPISKI